MIFTPRTPAEIRKSGDPQAIPFAEDNVKKVPTATEAIDIFERINRNRQS
ncbi:hypothetical protein ACAF76_000775 [Brevibacillus sp. TJ4]